MFQHDRPGPSAVSLLLGNEPPPPFPSEVPRETAFYCINELTSEWCLDQRDVPVHGQKPKKSLTFNDVDAGNENLYPLWLNRRRYTGMRP